MNIEDLLKKHTEGVELKLGEQKILIATLREQVSQIEQKGAGCLGQVPPSSLGQQLARSEKFAQFKTNGFQGSARFQLKAITTAGAGTAWSDRDQDIAGLPKRRVRVRDLLTVVPTRSGSVDYARQTTRTNNAAVVAEGAQKPTSAYVWDQVNLPMRTIAHLAKITRQALEDSQQLQGEVDSEMRFGLQLAEDEELLNGDGTGSHLTGLMPLASAFSSPFTMASPNMIDVIGLAILQQSLTEYMADGVVLHPTDWMKMRLIKDGDGKYILGDPNAEVTPMLFDRPVALTQAMEEGAFLVGGMKEQKLYDRMEPEVLIASENSDDFEKNLYTMRCEERLGLAVRKPGAMIAGDFAMAIAGATAP